MTYSDSSWAAKDWALCKNHNVKHFWGGVESPVSEVQLCSQQSSRTCSPPRLIRWKTVFLITLGSLLGFSGDEAQEGESWSRYKSRGRYSEVWTFPLVSVESFPMLQIRVKYPPGVRCRGLWSGLLAGSLAGQRGLLRHFLMLPCAGSLLETSDEHWCERIQTMQWIRGGLCIKVTNPAMDHIHKGF